MPLRGSKILLMPSSYPPLGKTTTFTSTFVYSGSSYGSPSGYTSTELRTYATAAEKEGATARFGAAAGDLGDHSYDKATNAYVDVGYYEQTKDVHAGQIFYITIFAELMLAAIVFGVSRRMPILSLIHI